MVEELHLGHPDDGGRPPLLLLAQRPGLLRRRPRPSRPRRASPAGSAPPCRPPSRRRRRPRCRTRCRRGAPRRRGRAASRRAWAWSAMIGSLPPPDQRAAASPRAASARPSAARSPSAARRAHQPEHQQPADDAAAAAGEEHVPQAVGVAGGRARRPAGPRSPGRPQPRICRACPADSAEASARRVGGAARPAAPRWRRVGEHACRAPPPRGRSRAAGRCSPRRTPCRCARAARPPARPRPASGWPSRPRRRAPPARRTSTRQVESASTSAMQQPPTPISSSPTPRTNRGGSVCRNRPPAPATTKLQRRQRDEDAAGLQRRQPADRLQPQRGVDQLRRTRRR